MSQALDLLNNLSPDEMSRLAGANPNEARIVIGEDRTIYIPPELRRIAVQFDHNIETVTFECPRYWDGHDMSTMAVSINYMRQDGYTDSYPAAVTSVTEDDKMLFDWTISGNVTEVSGKLSFLVCVKQTNTDTGELLHHWSSELSQDMYVSGGMKCEAAPITRDPDLVSQILQRLSNVELAPAILFTEQELTPEQQAQARKNIGAGLPPFRFTVEKVGGQYTSSKTAQELSDAYAEGRTLICEYGEYDLPMVRYVPETSFIFFANVEGYDHFVSVNFFHNTINVNDGAHAIQIGDQTWPSEDSEFDVDFTDTINGMIDDKVSNITVDDELSKVSTRPVQNRIVTTKFDTLSGSVTSVAEQVDAVRNVANNANDTAMQANDTAMQANDTATQTKQDVEELKVALTDTESILVSFIDSQKVCNVTDYGAVGDGETDDTEAIQEALHNAERSGVPLYIPAGNYLVSKTITTYRRDTESDKQSKTINIYGDGMNTVFTTTANFDGEYVFYIDVANVQPRQLWVHDFAIDLVADVSGIYFNEIGMKSVIENLWITHLYDKDPDDTNVRAGIYCRSATVTTFQRIKVFGNRKSSGRGHENIGIVCAETHSTKFIDCDITFCKWAIYINHGSNNLIAYCRIDENEYGVFQNSVGDGNTPDYMPETRAYPASKFNGTLYNLTIRNNRFEGNNQQAIFLAAFGTGVLKYMYNAQVVIAENYFTALGAGTALQTTAREVFRKAIHLHKCKGVVIEYNTFKGKPYDESNDETLLQNIECGSIEDITIRGNVAIASPRGKDENGNTIVQKANTRLSANFLAVTGFVDDIEVDQSSRGGNIEAALDSIIAIQESLIGGDGE